MLLTSIAVLGLAVLAGGWLGAQVLMLEETPPLGLHWKGLAHGATGLAGLAVLVAALWGAAPALHAVRMGAGGFGRFSAALIAGAAVIGLTILLQQVRRRPLKPVLIAAHGLLGITGYTLLVTYLTMLH